MIMYIGMSPVSLLPLTSPAWDQTGKDHHVLTVIILISLPQALKLMAAQNNDIITCPRTKDTVNFSEVKKVFVM